MASKNQTCGFSSQVHKHNQAELFTTSWKCLRKTFYAIQYFERSRKTVSSLNDFTVCLVSAFIVGLTKRAVIKNIFPYFFSSDDNLLKNELLALSGSYLRFSFANTSAVLV